MRLVALGLLFVLTASGCAWLADNRPACRWGSAGIGFVAGGLIGGFAVNSLDLSGTTSGGATIGGAVGVGAVGALIGAIVGNYACPAAPAPPAPPEPPASSAPVQ